MSLNMMRSTQIFNKILYKSSYSILKRRFDKEYKKITIKRIFDKAFECTCEFSKMDSYCVTILSGRKSWGTISRIKHSEYYSGIYYD